MVINMTRGELIEAILLEIMDNDYSSSALSGSPLTSGAKKAFSGAKKAAKKSIKAVNHEMVTPTKSLVRAVKYKIEADKVKRSGGLARAKTMHHRANAVIMNRGSQVAAAGVGGAISGLAVPMPGSGEAGMVASSKAAKAFTKRVRARRKVRMGG